MSCWARAFMCSGRHRRARIPAWMPGCRVLTRPSRISGNPVTRATGTAGHLAWVRSAVVPPVETISKPRSASPRASSTIPSLRYTERRARLFIGYPPSPFVHPHPFPPGRGRVAALSRLAPHLPLTWRTLRLFLRGRILLRPATGRRGQGWRVLLGRDLALPRHAGRVASRVAPARNPGGGDRGHGPGVGERGHARDGRAEVH